MAIGGKVSNPFNSEFRNKAVSFLKPAIKSILSSGKPKPTPGYHTYPPAATQGRMLGSNNTPTNNPSITSAPKPPPSAPMAPPPVNTTMKKGGKVKRGNKK